MFGNREVCIGLSVAVEILPLVEIMQLAAHFVKRFTHDIDTLSRALTACLLNLYSWMIVVFCWWRVLRQVHCLSCSRLFCRAR
jgi:hypothetical protein